MLASVADLEAWLKLSAGNTDEALLTRLLTAESTFIETWCSRIFSPTDYVETRDGNGQSRMSPQCWPMLSIASVVVDGTAIPAAVGATGSGYFIVGKSIQLRGYSFTRGAGNVVLSYNAGFATIPADVQQAAIELAAMRYRERDRVGMSSISGAGETTSFITRDMPASVLTLLGQYKQVVPR